MRYTPTETGSLALGALLEGFDEARHPRGWHGRWIGSELHVFHGGSKITMVSASGSSSRERLLSAVQGAVRARPGRPGIDRVEAQRVVDLAAGMPPRRAEAYRGLGAIEPREHRPGDKVHVVNTTNGVRHPVNGVVQKPAESYDVITSRGAERSRTIEVKWSDGDVTHERPEDVNPGHRPGGDKPPDVKPIVIRPRARESAPVALGALLEADRWDPAKHPRGLAGRFVELTEAGIRAAALKHNADFPEARDEIRKGRPVVRVNVSVASSKRSGDGWRASVVPGVVAPDGGVWAAQDPVAVPLRRFDGRLSGVEHAKRATKHLGLSGASVPIEYHARGLA